VFENLVPIFWPKRDEVTEVEKWGKLREKTLGRPRRRWEDNTKIDI
jgi:hypothetical protein